MFKDVVSKGWMRLHIVFFFISLSVTFVLAFAYSENGYQNRPPLDLIADISIVLSPALSYTLIFLIAIWVKRGFKKS